METQNNHNNNNIDSSNPIQSTQLNLDKGKGFILF